MRLEDVAFSPATWTVVASQTHAASTATKAAVTRQRHFITGFSFSASGGTPAIGTVQVKDGSTVIDQIEIAAGLAATPDLPFSHEYTRPLRCSVNSAASITVGDLGAGIIGTVALRGFSVTD